MEEERRRDSFTKEDRILLKSINGEVKRHKEEIFGDDDKKTTGLKEDVSDLKTLAIQFRTAVKVVGALIAVLGVTNIAILFRGG